MTEENTDQTPEIANTQFRVESANGGPMKDAETIRLVVEGDPGVVGAVAEVALAFLQAGLGGKIVGAQDGSGNPLPYGPEVIDVLSTGDESVA